MWEVWQWSKPAPNPYGQWIKLSIVSAPRYVCKDWIAGSILHTQLQEEKEKILQQSIMAEEFANQSFSDFEDTPRSSCAGTPTGTPRKYRPIAPLSPLLSADDDAIAHQHHKKKQAHMTYRLLKRANMVLAAVREAKLIDNIYYIQKRIIDEEALEGVKGRLDKKSLMRIIQRLATQGQIKSIKTLLKFGKEEKEVRALQLSLLDSLAPGRFGWKF